MGLTAHGGHIWIDYNERLMAICGGVWEAVRGVLCFDTPEGADMDDEEIDNIDVGAKDTLSYCWRALKESRSVSFPARHVGDTCIDRTTTAH